MVRKTFIFEGKRYYIRGKDAVEAAVKAELKKQELERGITVMKQSITVKEWSEKWISAYKRAAIESVTLRGYKSRLNAQILPAIGYMQLRDVKPIHCQNVLNQLSGYSKEYINKVAYTMFQMFETAKDNELILKNPTMKLTKPKAEDGTHRAITKQERECILQVAEHHPGGLWMKLMLYCGLRPDETSIIQGRHFDFEAKTLRVEGTKTKSANRIVPIPDIIIEDFKKLNLGPNDYLFTNRRGARITDSNRQTLWESFKRDMNVAMGCEVYRNQVIPPFQVADDLVPYCMRHTYCTDLQAAGVPINVAKELMGHTSISVTARIYTHQSEKAFNNAVDLINKHHTEEDEKDGTETAHGSILNGSI